MSGIGKQRHKRLGPFLPRIKRLAQDIVAASPSRDVTDLLEYDVVAILKYEVTMQRLLRMCDEAERIPRQRRKT